MSSTEPPSRSGPRSQPQDTKAARDELSSKGKVEKVREIDADEQARKKRFLKYYKDDAAEEEHVEIESRPSPFDLLSGKQDASNGGLMGSSKGSFSDDVDNAIIPAPNYTPPPSVGSFEGENAEEDEEAVTGTTLGCPINRWLQQASLSKPRTQLKMPAPKRLRKQLRGSLRINKKDLFTNRSPDSQSEPKKRKRRLKALSAKALL
jgi:hypothetical protein